MIVERQNLSPSQFGRFRDFIYAKCGIRIDEKKITMLSHRIRSRLKAGNFPDFDRYYEHLTSLQGRDEIEFFLDAVTTNETFFFRTESHFEWFKKEFISQRILAHRANLCEASIRIWSAACSTGEEAYSLAICVAENSLRLKDWSIDIVATDISEAVLRKARDGKYKKRSIEGLNKVRIKRWLSAEPDGETWAVRDEIQQYVHFMNHNLMQRINQDSFDCIFIRNVLIYFDAESKRKVIENLIHVLKPGGYLVVGPSEGVYNMLDPLEKENAFLYKKPDLGSTR